MKNLIKKPKSSVPSSREMTAEEAVQFLEDFRRLTTEQDEHAVAISIRIPANILRAIKTQAKSKNQKYQSLIVSYLRKGLSTDRK